MEKKIAMSENFYILNNFPQEFLDEVRKYWDENHTNMETMEWAGDRKVAGTVTRKKMKSYDLPDDYLVKKFKEIFDSPLVKEGSFGYLYYAAGSGHFIHHYDIGRTAGINMPVCVDYDNSVFYSGDNGEELNDSDWDSMYRGEMEFEFRPENYKFYNMRKPILFNAKCPHNFANWANTDRVLFTLNFSSTAKEMKELLPQEWF